MNDEMEYLGFHDIMVDANRADEEPSRLDRLNGVAGYLRAILPPPLLHRVDCLYDHKGNLAVIVSGRRSPAVTEALQKAADQAWEAYCECNVEIVYEGETSDLGMYVPVKQP
jgi:hypothetical protein